MTLPSGHLRADASCGGNNDRNIGGSMRRTAIALLAAGLALAGCSEQHKPDPAACKRAVKAQYEPGTAKLKGAPDKPKACDGLTDDQVSQIVLSVIQENTQ